MSHANPTPPMPVPPGWANTSYLVRRYAATPAEVKFWIFAGALDGVPSRKQGERKRTIWLKKMLPSRHEIDQRVSDWRKNQGRPHVAVGKPVVPQFLEM